MAIQETRLAPNNAFRTHQVYRSDREQARVRAERVALLVRNTLDHHQGPKPQLQDLKAVQIVVNTRDSGPFHSRLHDHDLSFLIPRGTQLVATGDFNAKARQWNSRITNTRGKVLLRYLDAHQELTVLGPPAPTHDGGGHQGSSTSQNDSDHGQGTGGSPFAGRSPTRDEATHSGTDSGEAKSGVYQS